MEFDVDEVFEVLIDVDEVSEVLIDVDEVNDVLIDDSLVCAGADETFA